MPTYDPAVDELLASGETLHGYDRWAPSYDTDPNALVHATSWVLERAPLGCADAEVIELGCGTGRNAQRVIAEGARSYLGLDGSQGMLAVAARRYHDPRVTFGAVDLLAPWPNTRPSDFALIVLVLEHLPTLEPMLASLARAMRPGARARIVEFHPERIAAGAGAHFREGARQVCFTSVSHSVPALCAACEAVGFDVVRRDWLATDTMVAAVPGLAPHRGQRLLLDLKLTKRDRRA